jgi:hypothetical protein
MSELRNAGAEIAQWGDIYDSENIHSQQWMDYGSLEEVRRGIPAVNLPFDFEHTDETWHDKYGITSVPLLVRSASGRLYDDKRLKGLFVDGKYKRIVSRKYVVFPNEEVDELIKEIAEQQHLTIGKTHESHYGDAMYWEILDSIPEYVEPNDQISLGCIVRNSLGAGVALGADIFTYRLICANGAIARGQDLGSVALRHMGTHDQMLDKFTLSISNVIEESHTLVQTYRKATQIRMNLLIAEEFVKYIPERALPESIEVTRKDAKVVGIALRERDTLWETFNDITKAAWHHRRTGWMTKSGILQRAHWVLFHATAAA